MSQYWFLWLPAVAAIYWLGILALGKRLAILRTELEMANHLNRIRYEVDSDPEGAKALGKLCVALIVDLDREFMWTPQQRAQAMDAIGEAVSDFVLVRNSTLESGELRGRIEIQADDTVRAILRDAAIEAAQGLPTVSVASGRG